MTAGAALAQSDLMLHLLRPRFGVALADAVARVLLIDGRQAQAPFAVPAMMANGSELIRRLTQRIEASLPRRRASRRWPANSRCPRARSRVTCARRAGAGRWHWCRACGSIGRGS